MVSQTALPTAPLSATTQDLPTKKCPVSCETGCQTTSQNDIILCTFLSAGDRMTKHCLVGMVILNESIKQRCTPVLTGWIYTNNFTSSCIWLWITPPIPSYAVLEINALFFFASYTPSEVDEQAGLWHLVADLPTPVRSSRDFSCSTPTQDCISGEIETCAQQPLSQFIDTPLILTVDDPSIFVAEWFKCFECFLNSGDCHFFVLRYQPLRGPLTCLWLIRSSILQIFTHYLLDNKFNLLLQKLLLPPKISETVTSVTPFRFESTSKRVISLRCSPCRSIALDTKVLPQIPILLRYFGELFWGTTRVYHVPPIAAHTNSWIVMDSISKPFILVPT